MAVEKLAQEAFSYDEWQEAIFEGRVGDLLNKARDWLRAAEDLMLKSKKKEE